MKLCEVEAVQEQLVEVSCALQKRLETLVGDDEKTLWKRSGLIRTIVALGEVFEGLEREKKS